MAVPAGYEVGPGGFWKTADTSGPYAQDTSGNMYLIGRGGTGTTATQVQGTAADGAAVTGSPVLIGGQDGTNAQSILTDTTGRQVMVGAAADGAAAAGNPVQIGGVDGSGNTQALATDTAGNQYVRSALQTTSAMTQAAITFAASGDNTVVSAGAGGVTTRVHRMFIVVAAATAITIKNGAGTSLTGAMSLSAGGSIVLEFSQEPWFKTSAATAFIINSSNAVQVSGMVDYMKD